MKFTAAAATLALAAGVSAVSNSTGDVYVTEVVTAYTTYCPYATSIVHGSKTYTVSEATTLTISDCPCTVTRPASSAVASAAAGTPATSAVAVSSVAAVSSAAAVSTAPYAITNGTTTGQASGVAAASGTVSVGSASSSTTGKASSPSVYAGSASANTVSGAVVAAMGLAALFL